MTLIEKYKPAVKKRTLLCVAGFAWIIAGSILIVRALVMLVKFHHNFIPELLLGILLGTTFYVFLFTKISKKHITRISLIKADFPCFFSFFNYKSYILMIIMITTGIILRKTNVINAEYLYTFYLAMGLPLIFSAFRFFIAAFKNKIHV